MTDAEIVSVAGQPDYTNMGRPLVLQDLAQADQLVQLFRERSVWYNYELVQRVGWRFGASIFVLRRHYGWNIRTKCMGKRVFAYYCEQEGRDVQ